MKKGRTLLRVLRAQQEPKISQSQLARRVEALLPNGRTMSAGRYWQIERAEGTPPRDDEKIAIASALNVTVSDIAWPEQETAKAS